MKKRRLDEILIERGIAADRSEAFIKVTEGLVFVNSQKAISPAQMVGKGDRIEVRGEREYVGRGAYKLEAALVKFDIDVREKVCADIGSATGGFVEVLLRHDAKKVYAIDTARGKLALKLRQDPRVIVMEGTDVRDIKKLPERIDLATSDVSLISLREILPAVTRIAPAAEVIALFKPQYETRPPTKFGGRTRDQSILRHGIVKDAVRRERLLRDFTVWAKENSWQILGEMESPIRGSEGNIEYLLYLKHP